MSGFKTNERPQYSSSLNAAQVKQFTDNSFMWQEVLIPRFLKNGGMPDYACDDITMRYIVQPILKQWDAEFRHNAPILNHLGVPIRDMAIFTLTEMSDAELYFSAGLLRYETFIPCARQSYDMALEKSEIETRWKSPKEKIEILATGGIFQFHPSMHQLFKIMIDSPDDTCQIPLKKEYISCMDNIRKGADLCRTFCAPSPKTPVKRDYKADSLVVADDMNQTRYNILSALVDIRNSFHKEKQPWRCNDLETMLSLLTRQFYLDQVAVLKSIPEHERDMFLTDRAKIGASLLKNIVNQPQVSVAEHFDKHLASCAGWVYDMIQRNPNLPDYKNCENAMAF